MKSYFFFIRESSQVIHPRSHKMKSFSFMGESSLLISLGVINEKFFYFMGESSRLIQPRSIKWRVFSPRKFEFRFLGKKRAASKAKLPSPANWCNFFNIFFSIYLNKKGYISPKRVLRSPNSVRDALVFTRTRLQPPQNQRYPVLPELCAVSVFTLVRFKQPQEHRYPVLQVYGMFKCLPDGMKIWTVCFCHINLSHKFVT